MKISTAQPQRNYRAICTGVIIIFALIVAPFSNTASADDTSPPATTQETVVEQTPAEPTPTAPAPAPAQTTQSGSSTESTQQGPTSPTGADSTAYTYNEATGLWENDKYTWDPATKQTAPKVTPTYSYNPQTGHWDTTKWIYDAPSGTYVANTVSSATPPPTLPDSASKTNGKQSAPTEKAVTTNLGQPGKAKQPTQHKEATASPASIYDSFFNAAISNTILSQAVSGDAIVTLNTLAGDALSGDATAIATVLNLLQTVWDIGNPGAIFTTFTQNILGSIFGDLRLTPPEGQQNTKPHDNVAINSSNDATIHNTLQLEASTGDAAVTNNTAAGSAASGDATAIANIVNAINSSITAGQSFLGMLNIYGSLDGDILLPDGFLEKILATNTIGQLDTSPITNADILGQFNTNQTIANNLSTSARSGTATVSSNTEAGNAQSGDAQTNVTLLNLTGRQVIGKNALLVFVNVLGEWVGMIVDAPANTTSAAFAGGVEQDKAINSTLQSTNNQTIINDVTASVHTGDATRHHYGLHKGILFLGQSRWHLYPKVFT